MKWSCGAEKAGNDKKLEVQIWPLTFWPHINRNPPQVTVNIYVKYHHCISNGRGLIVQKPLVHRRTDRQTDRQTTMVKQVYLHNFVGGGIQTYFQCGKIVEKLPPWRSKFHGGSHFFTTFVSKFNVKFWPVSAFNVKKLSGESYLMLKNDTESHFSTGSLFNVTPACHTRCKCSTLTSRNLIKLKFGINIIKCV